MPFSHGNKKKNSAAANARTQSVKGPQFGVGLCLQRVRMCFGIGPVEPDATAAWHSAIGKHRDDKQPPRNTPVFWVGGSAGHGHIAIATGDGRCWSTDINRPGYFDLVDIDAITRVWGLEYVGWAEGFNGKRVYWPPKTRGANVDRALKHLKDAKGNQDRLNTIAKARRLLRSLKPWAKK
jgi:hypothetical protein